MNLLDELNKIPKGRWLYYTQDFAYINFEQAYCDSFEFVQKYFNLGGKSGFLPETIFGNANDKADRKEYDLRAKHVVSTYFLGIYLFKKIKFFKPGKTSLLAEKNNKNEFLWAWFLCSLYHDAFYNCEKDDSNTNTDIERIRDCHFGYCKNSWRLLYDKKTIKKYYEKNQKGKEQDKDNYTSFNGEIHYDHGILGAEWLYINYKNKLDELFMSEENRQIYKLGGILVDENGLKLDKAHFNAVCNISKVIASHNIHICDKNYIDSNGHKDIDKYRNAKLENLIPGEVDFHKMPYNKYGKFGVYDKMYLLLSLVDSIEPTKKEIDLKDIDIEVSNLNNYKYEIAVQYNKLSDMDKIKQTISAMPSWLKYIVVENNGNIIKITLDFSSFRERKYL